MKTQHGNKKENPATAQVQMRVTDDEKNKLVSLAQKERKTLTRYILDRCLSE